MKTKGNIMEPKKYLYAAVGAPVAAAKAAQARVGDVRSRINTNVGALSKDLHRQIDEWVTEGESLINRIGDSPTIDELTDRVDLEQVQEQVTRLRDQLEDLLATWRNNFRPGAKLDVQVAVSESGRPEVKTSVETPSTRQTTPRTGSRATTSPSGTKAKSSGTAAKKTPASKAPAGKKPATKTGTTRTSGTPASKSPASKSPASSTSAS